MIMEGRINVAELLKDCPKGMELDCVLNDNVTFECILDGNCYPIQIQTPEGNMRLSQYGCMSLSRHAKCVIFPKGKTTWEGFQRPFKDGDVVTNIEGAVIIYKGITTYGFCGSFVSLDKYNQFIPHYESYLTGSIRLSTEEEKEKLFKAIKDNGYNWNTETKTLEKLIVSKFDISLLKPFDKVLVRDENLLEDSDITDATWSAALYSHNKFGDNACPYVTTNGHFAQCVPYKDNEHLLGTTDDCDEYYKTWE